MDMSQQTQMTIGGAFAASAVVLPLAILTMRKHVRLEGAASWLLFIFVSPWPVIAAMFLADLAGLPLTAGLPPAAVAVVLGFLSYHFLMPALLPDFHTESVSTSAMLGVVLGLALLGAGFMSGQFVEIVPSSQGDAFGGSSVEWK